MDKSRFHELKATGELPSPTGVAMTILKLIQDDDSDFEEIARAIRADPALAGRLLKFANSPFWRRNRAIVSLRDALTVVGLHTVKQLVLGISVLSKYRDGICNEFDYQCFWSHSLATAIATQALCAELGAFPQDDAFTCGLLCRVGELALATIYPQEYGDVLRSSSCKPTPERLQDEQKYFLTDHLELGAAMLCDWGLPSIYTDALGGLYQPELLEKGEHRSYTLARYLNLTTQLASICVKAGSSRSHLVKTLSDYAQQFDIDQPALAALFDRVVAEWKDWGQLLDIAAPQVPSFEQLLVEAEHEPHEHSVGHVCEKGVLRVVVVDDDPVALEMLQGIIRHLGHQPLAAGDGEAALRIIMEADPHVVIADLNMPHMDGLTLCRSLRNTKQGQRLYIIIVTIEEEVQKMIDAFDAGVDDYITKPLCPQIVEARLQGGERVISLQTEVYQEREETRKLLAELAIANRKLEHAALTDPLTNLPNRRYATGRLKQIWSASNRTGGALCCMLVDIDHFKQINDQYGHAVGDTVLREVAVALRSAARAEDEVCRIGGEEFLVICLNTDPKSVQAAGERLRCAVENYRAEMPDFVGKLTVSIGIAMRAPSHDNPEDLLNAADKAVYVAKRKGRNRVCIVADQTPKMARTGNYTIN